MSEARANPRRLKRWALVAVLLLAAFLRLYRIADLPPGDGYDPAWYGVDALQILKGHFPVYLPTNIGREALFSYLVAIAVGTVGVGPHAIHLASAIVGLLTVPATYLVAEALFRDEPEPLRSYGGVLSALALTVSFWHQQWSRYGVRAILVPLLTALTLWALVRTLSAGGGRRQWGWASATGALLGLSLYTYQSARVLPVLVASVVVLRAGLRGWSWRQASAFLLLAGVAALVFAPMGLYLARNPGVGNERIDQTWAISPDHSLVENARSIWAEAKDAVRVLAIDGDNEVIHNLPGRPAMNAFLLALVCLGTLVALSRVYRWPYWVLLLWLPAMSVTAVLTLGGQPTKRALGALPAIAMLIAAGALLPMGTLLRRSRDRGPVPMARVAALLWGGLVAAGFIYSGYATFRDYFVVWGQDPNLWTHFEGGRVAIGRYAGSLSTDEVIYSSPEMPDHPSIVYNSGGRTDVRGYNGRICTVYPAVTEAPTTYIIVQHEESQSLELLRRIYPEGREEPAGPDYFGQPYFTAYRVPAGAAAQISPQTEVLADWDQALRFLGFDAHTTEVTPGATLGLTLYTQSLAKLDRDYVLFVHLIHAGDVQNPATSNALWAQDDSAPCRGFYPTSAWHPGEIVRDTYTLAIPADAPAGRYDIQMGFYTWPDFQHLATTAGPQGTPTVSLTFGEIAVE